MNVKYECDKCHHTAFAPPDTEPACRENLGNDCEMEQVEDFNPAPKPVKAPAKKASGGTHK
jgi:hypothetical protein